MAKTRRILKRGKRTTRSNKGGETIESLQASFEKVDSKARALIEQGRTDSELVAALKDIWSDQFSADLSHVAAVGLVKHYRSIHKAVRKTRKSQRRSQMGGMAPMGWTMGQGTTDFTFGRFPVELGTSSVAAKALDVGFKSSISSSCDSVGQGGGGLLDAIGMGHPPTSVPSNILQNAVYTAQGVPSSNTYDPVRATVPVASYVPQPFEPSKLTEISDMTALYKPL